MFSSNRKTMPRFKDSDILLHYEFQLSFLSPCRLEVMGRTSNQHIPGRIKLSSGKHWARQAGVARELQGEHWLRPLEARPDAPGAFGAEVCPRKIHILSLNPWYPWGWSLEKDNLVKTRSFGGALTHHDWYPDKNRK